MKNAALERIVAAAEADSTKLLYTGPAFNDGRRLTGVIGGLEVVFVIGRLNLFGDLIIKNSHGSEFALKLGFWMRRRVRKIMKTVRSQEAAVIKAQVDEMIDKAVPADWFEKAIDNATSEKRRPS